MYYIVVVYGILFILVLVLKYILALLAISSSIGEVYSSSV